jgi:hypothetical protein
LQDGAIGSVNTNNDYPVVPGGTVVGGAANPHQGAASTYALMWTAPSGSQASLHPAGFYSSNATAASADQQVGLGTLTSTGQYHALMWGGTAASAVDLHPSTFLFSVARGVGGGQQVGYGQGDNGVDALLWSGSAASVVDLKPTKLAVNSSYALGTDGTHQVGYGNRVSGGGSFAILWAGSGASAVSLEPTNLTGIIASAAVAVSGDQEAGWVQADRQQPHAALWRGTGTSAVDLNPTNLSWTPTGSEVAASNGKTQVGVGYGYGVNNVQHAMMWSETAASAVDLHALLPAGGVWFDSYASSVDEAGNVYGTADGTFDGVTGTYVVEWSAAAVPEPTGLTAVSLAMAAGLLGRRRRRN